MLRNDMLKPATKVVVVSWVFSWLLASRHSGLSFERYGLQVREIESGDSLEV